MVKKSLKSIQNAFKKLSSSNIVLLVFINVFAPLLSIPLAAMVGRYQLREGLIQALTFEVYEKTVLLLLLLIGVVLLALDILFLINPFYRLENLIRRYNSSRRTDQLWEYRMPDSLLAELFIDLLDEQKISMEHLYESEVLRQQTELMALQSQINPHFLYNTLDSIRGLALIHDIHQIADMAEALSRLFRSMVSREGRLIPLADELVSVESYMTIQQFRFNNRFVLKNQIKDSFLLQCKMPNLILQPIVENAIVHGLDDLSQGGYVSLSAYTTQEKLVLSVEDNGRGMGARELDKLNDALQCGEAAPQEGKEDGGNGTGIAMQNINRRIQLQFDERYGINVMSTENIGTVVEIVLPLIKDEHYE